MPPVAGKKDGRMDTLAKMCSVKECIRTADGAGVGKGNARWSFQGCLGGAGWGWGGQKVWARGPQGGGVGLFSGHLHTGHPIIPAPHPLQPPLPSSRSCGPGSPVQAR